MPDHIFISYARDDGEEFARHLHDDLESRHINAWLDIHDIPKGVDWDAEIDKALQSARAVAVVLTPGAVLSVQVKSEWNDALNRYLPIIPLFVRNCKVPRVLNVFNYIDFRDDYDAGIAALCQRLANLDNDHSEYLETSLSALEVAQQEAPEPRRFQAKLEDLRSIIKSWGQHVEIQGKRIADGLDEQRQQLFIPPPARQVIILGERPPNVTDHFKNRDSELKDIQRLLLQPSTRVVSVVGHSGIGKTALVSRVLDDLEANSWPHTSDNIPVNGVVCLNARPLGITLEQLFLSCTKLLGGEREKILNAVWINPEVKTRDKVRHLLEALKEGLYVILLDNVEELLDDEGRIIDEDLGIFFESSLTAAYTARLLITSRIRLAFRREIMRFDQQVPLDKGLPVEEGVAFLRELDPNGIYGLRDAPGEQLIKAVERTQGVPRALQVIAAILDSDPFSNLNDILEQFLHHEKVVQELIEEGYRRLDNNARRVMEALAVFGRPVSPLAVDYLLEPFVPGLDVPSVLRRLTLTHMVSVDRTTKMVMLHPIDQDYAYSQLPEETGSSTYPRKALEHRAAHYYAQLRTPPDTWRTIHDLEPQLAEFEHWIKAGDLHEAIQVVQRIKRYLFAFGRHEQLTQMLQEIEPTVQDLIREQVGHKRVVVFLGTGDLAWNVMREFQSKETVTLAIDKVAIGWAHADFQIVLGSEGLRDRARIVTLLQSLIPSSIRELPYPPILLTYHSSFDSETVFQTAAQLGYKVIPNEKAAIMTTNKLRFWEQVKDAADIQPYLLARKPLFLPPLIVSRIRNDIRDMAVNKFLQLMLESVRAVGLPCVIKPIITELAYGQCIVLEDSEEMLWEALKFVIKETDNRKTNPGQGFLLEKAVEKPFIELIQGVIRYRDTAGQLRTVCWLPILAERKDRSDIGDKTQQLVRGPFIFYNAFHTHKEEDWPEQIRKHKKRIQEISIKLVDLSGGDEGIYGIGFFLKGDQIWIGDHFVVKPEDKMLVTKATHKLNAFRLLANIIEDVPMSEADILAMRSIGGARTILWCANEETELETVEGTELASRTPYVTSVEVYSEKKQMWPLRIMGLILAEAPQDLTLMEIRKALDAAEAHITLVPRKSV